MANSKSYVLQFYLLFCITHVYSRSLFSVFNSEDADNGLTRGSPASFSVNVHEELF